MPGSAINSCFPKIKRPQPQPDLRDPPFPFFITSFKHGPPLSPELHYGHQASTTPDLSAAYASGRFFISSPGQSNSIVNSSASAASSSSFGSDTSVMKNSVAVPTYSPDPYADFRRSMEEMVEAREGGFRQGDKRGTGSWEYLHELLLCYLALNPKATHKFIIGAFADLVVDHMSAAPPAAATRRRHKAAVDAIKGSRLK